MYLSRLILDPRDRFVQRDLADCRQLHRTVLSAFPDIAADTPNARETLGVLFRLEETSVFGPPQVLVQSRLEPDWRHLKEGYLYRRQDNNPNPETGVMERLWADVRAGDRFIFRLRANPTKKVPKNADDRWGGKRVSIDKEEAQLNWLDRKADQGGFKILTVTTDPRAVNHANGHDTRGEPARDVDAAKGPRIIGWKSNSDTRQKMTFGSVLFNGRLEVTDRDRFLKTVECGIGSGKAFGFGLLSVLPVRR
jgi:CRISPR system Cascade subunit CasE